MSVDDQELWKSATACLHRLRADLAGDVELALTTLLTRYRLTKEVLAAVIAEVDAADVCRECQGACCLNGKYRINVCDVLACIAAESLVTPDFSQKPVCPYGTAAGCRMAPGVRPADCILFICVAIDQKLSPAARLILDEQERVLRECLHEASRLTGEPLGTPLLLWAGRNTVNPNLKM